MERKGWGENQADKERTNQVEKQVPNGTGSWASSWRRRMVGHERETFGTGETASGN